MSAVVSDLSLPSNAAGRALTQLLDLLRAEGDLDADAVLALFHPSFVAAVGREPLLGGLAPHQAVVRSSRLLRCSAQGEDGVSAVFESPDGLWKFVLTLAEEQIAMLQAGSTGQGSGISWPRLLEVEPPAAGFSTLAPDVTSALDEIVTQARTSQELPGVLAAVADAQGELLWVRTLGVASLEPLAPVTAGRALRIGSITKTMTTALVMQLVDEGLVDLDDDVNTHLVSYTVSGPGGEVLTVRQLLTHTSGLGMRPGIELACPLGEEPALGEFYGPELVGQLPPASAFLYSNDAFATLGQLVADVTGVTLAERAAASLFDPLGMSHTSYLRDGRTSPDLFEGIDVDAGELAPVPFTSVVPAGAGSVYSTLADMALYAAAVHGRGGNHHGRVLSEAAFSTMTAPRPDVTDLPPGTQMCLGWLRIDLPETYLLWHNGGWPGARSELGVLPELGYSVLLFANTLDADLDPVCMQLAAALSSS